jgi:hypothetical protein
MEVDTRGIEVEVVVVVDEEEVEGVVEEVTEVETEVEEDEVDIEE